MKGDIQVATGRNREEQFGTGRIREEHIEQRRNGNKEEQRETERYK
jgi:hypothetical protein